MFLALVLVLAAGADANPDAKRLYDDLLSHYNRLIRPVSNNSEVVTVRLGLHLSQLIDLVSVRTPGEKGLPLEPLTRTVVRPRRAPSASAPSSANSVPFFRPASRQVGRFDEKLRRGDVVQTERAPASPPRRSTSIPAG